MLAVIKTGGKQYKVAEGQELKIEKIDTEVGKKVNFEEVLLVSDEKGENIKIGEPLVKDVKIEAEVLEQGRDKKVEVVKYKAKTRYKKVYGHRQPFTKVKIGKIG
ncbi:50S ribosomal protein L21 [Candidatus Falkowbacteria bacterium]|nr:50S ribosomal protein L21 [Candidatus Falkowbacteria bacterium]MBT4433150.1 50S ribosomal protein L21 [Candidatus Falkowbacteria bacterium]